MTTAPPYVEVSAVSKSFQTGAARKPVLRDVSFSLARGEFLSIVGAMGTGKSTLLGLVAGLRQPDSGRITVAGEPVRDIRADTAVVFQHYSLLPWLTALENVRLAVGSASPQMPRSEQRDKAHAALARVGLGHAVTRRPAQLSGGMRQRVAIARALVTDPELLLLDDPFGALDALTREALQQDLSNLESPSGHPVTILLITNNVDEAILLSDRIVPTIPGPPATLGEPIAVDLPRPRTAASLQHDEDASRVRARVVATLAATQPRRIVGRPPVQAHTEVRA